VGLPAMHASRTDGTQQMQQPQKQESRRPAAAGAIVVAAMDLPQQTAVSDSIASAAPHHPSATSTTKAVNKSREAQAAALLKAGMLRILAEREGRQAAQAATVLHQPEAPRSGGWHGTELWCGSRAAAAHHVHKLCMTLLVSALQALPHCCHWQWH